uniref:UNC93-like protein n=1 Tax=Globodera pallida TaxID=36090 RepID=A0A183CQQ3_GLOPA
GILAKQFRKERRAILREMEGPKLKKMKWKIGTDLLVISLAFLFLFTGFNGLQTLQTAINGDMGADSLCVLYLCMAIFSLFVPPFILKRLGCKRTLVIGIGIHVLYFAANFIPRYYSLIPTSIVAGMAASCVWASKCVYITESAIKYAKLNVESTGVGQVLGNVLSSLILGSAIERFEPEDRVDYTCGHSFLVQNLSERAQRNLSPPPRLAFLAVVGIDLCCAIVACVTVKLFLNPLQKQTTTASGKGIPPSSRDPTKFSTPIFRLTLRNLRRPKSDLLIPLTIFNGIEQAFAVGLYTKAYVGCGLGISEIGFVMTSFGVADAICRFSRLAHSPLNLFSLVFGPLIKLFGRMPLLMFGAVINLLMIITLMIWVVNPGDRTLFNAVAGVWGMADGVWNTQLNGEFKLR